MRVTQNSMVRNYLRTMNRNLSRLSKSEQRMLGQKYSKASESISDTSRALRVRQELFQNDLYSTNVRDVQGRLSSAESNLSSINEILQSAREQLIGKGMNDPNATARDTIATELENLRDEILQFANAQFSGSYLFGGTENGEGPFDVNADGRMTYHGYAVDDIRYDETDGKYYYNDPADPASPSIAIPQNGDQYIDVGLGLTMSGDSVDGKSAFKITFSGLEVLGFGKSADGVSNNVFNMLNDAAALLRDDPLDRDALQSLSKNLEGQNELLNLQISEIGTKTQFLEKAQERIENDVLNLTTLQQKLEVSNTAEESMNWKMYSALMSATYQFSSQVLPMSLMDFIK